MSLQFDPRLLLEENEQRLEDLQLKLTNVSTVVDKGIAAFCNSPGINCTITTTRNQFSSMVREQANLKRIVAEVKNNIRLLTREIELRTTPFTVPEIRLPESIDIDPGIQLQPKGIDLKTVALIGGGLLLLS